MQIIQDSQKHLSTEHLILSVPENGVLVVCRYAVEDLILNSPEGEILIAWNNELMENTSFPINACFSIPGKPDLKEIGKVGCTCIALKSVKGVVKVYLTLQRN